GLKLWWKNVKFIQHPGYTNPTYKDEALIRERKLQCCPFSAQRGSNKDCLAGGSPRERWFKWTDAKWPWS
ncbi:hypothetical protein A2U01_0058132, partial [Trifolium medium]|nr:hypothetical protein [Trifolium medium]